MLYNVVVQGCQHQGFFKKYFIIGHSFTFYVITVIYIKLAVFGFDKYFLSEMGLKIRGYNV